MTAFSRSTVIKYQAKEAKPEYLYTTVHWRTPKDRGGGQRERGEAEGEGEEQGRWAGEEEKEGEGFESWCGAVVC